MLATVITTTAPISMSSDNHCQSEHLQLRRRFSDCHGMIVVSFNRRGSVRSLSPQIRLQRVVQLVSNEKIISLVHLAHIAPVLHTVYGISRTLPPERAS